MGAARGFWDAAKHPRGVHGHFGAGSGGRVVKAKGKPDRKPRIYETKSVFTGHNLASATTAVFHPKSSGRKRAIVRFTPALHSSSTGYRDVRMRSEYSEGKLARYLRLPSGELHLIEPAGFKQAGHTFMPPGYVNEQLAKQKSRRARAVMGLAHKS